MKYFVLSIVLFLVGVGLTQIEREQQTFTPVLRLRTADGMFMTVLQPAASKRSACHASVQRLTEDIDRTCLLCTVESTECAMRLEGMEKALAAGERLPIYTIAAEGVRIGMIGPPRTVRLQCEGMAAEMAKLGVTNASCAAPMTYDKPAPS